MPTTSTSRTAEQRRADDVARAHAIREDADFLARTGVAIYDAAPRLGFRSPKALDKYLRRHGGAAILAALNRNNMPGIVRATRQEARAS